MLATVDAVYGAVKKLPQRNSRRYSPPCITARRGGRAIKKISRSIRRSPRSASALARSLKKCRGGFPMRTKGKPPRLRRLRWLREIFLMTQTPLLAVMQGGESRQIPIFHSSYDRASRRNSLATQAQAKALD